VIVTACQGQAPWTPPHVSFNHQSYTSLIYIFYSNLYITNIHLQVLMFNSCCDTHISSELQKVRVPLGIHSNLKFLWIPSQIPGQFQQNSMVIPQIPSSNPVLFSFFANFTDSLIAMTIKKRYSTHINRNTVSTITK